MARAKRFSIAACFLLALAACAPERAELTPVGFDALDGWQEDAAADALKAFSRSCEAMAERADQNMMWADACINMPAPSANNRQARAYFEKWFEPYEVNGGEEGLFTGYYAPELRGARHRGGKFQTPLYALPSDLVTADLGAFRADLKGMHVAGRVVKGRFIPYDDRAAIARGSIMRRAKILAWVDDPTDAFFLEVQGSGRIRFKNGQAITVGYAGANGRGYVAIGRALLDRGDLQRPVTMPAIRAWLAAHPDKAQAVLNLNPSYVFFRRLPDGAVLGSEGIALTPLRSLAVDPAFVPLGVPVWLETQDAYGAPLNRLMIAQDTGGAIKGPVRGDFFWGFDAKAAEEAGAMQSNGHYYLLLPKKNER